MGEDVNKQTSYDTDLAAIPECVDVHRMQFLRGRAGDLGKPTAPASPWQNGFA
jgi:hypothetical protein